MSDTTGITAAFLRHERNLSVALPEFLQWLHITTQEIFEVSNAPHTPGNTHKLYTMCMGVPTHTLVFVPQSLLLTMASS